MAPATGPTDGRHGTLIDMPGKGTRNRTIRVDYDLWNGFGQFTADRDRDRAGLLRDFIRFCIENPDEATRLIEQWRASARTEGEASE